MDFRKFSKSLMGGSIILLISINIFNALNFLFHFFMARMLTISDYGILAALMSIVYVLTIPSEAIQTIISKYTANEKDQGKLKNITHRAIKKGFKISIKVLALYLLAAIFLSWILAINYILLALLSVLIVFVFTIPVTRGVMQGKRKFNSLGFNMVFGSIVKIVLAVLLVLLGWRIYGAIAGVIIGALLAFIISFIPIRDLFKFKEKHGATKEIYSHGKPIFTIIFLIVIFYSLDILLARIFFSPDLAGVYAIASMIAKIIFLGTLPISKAMFPISASYEKDKKKASKIFQNSILMLSICIAIALIIILAFPDLLVWIFAGRSIPASASILIYIALATSLISFSNLILLYNASIGRTKNYLLLSIFLVIEIALLSYFNSNLVEYSLAFVTASAALLWGSINLLGKN